MPVLLYVPGREELVLTNEVPEDLCAAVENSGRMYECSKWRLLGGRGQRQRRGTVSQNYNQSIEL